MNLSTDILHFSSFYPNDTVVTKGVESENKIYVYLKSKTHEQNCPNYKQKTSKYHSTYKR